MTTLATRSFSKLLVNHCKGAVTKLTLRASMATTSEYKFETLKITSPSEYVYHIELNRPDRRNALSTTMWKELKLCFNSLSIDSSCRVVVLSGAGKLFCSGIDLECFGADVLPDPKLDVGRKAFALERIVGEFQASFTAIEKCAKPVLTAIHGGCIGAGVDMICAADMRYATEDAWFQIKEVDLGIVADVGTLQRLPKIVGNESLVRELAFTARRFSQDEARQMGLVSRIFPDKDAMVRAVLEVASTIASKSPVAIQGTKESLIFARDHTVDESLKQVRLLNQALLQSEDVVKAVGAAMSKETPVFSKL